MPYLSFIHPEALWLVLLLVPLWALALLGPRRLSPLRFWASLGLRTVLVLLLVLSLAGTQIVHGVDQLTTVFLIDSSDSISPTARSQAENFVQEALASKQADDRSAIVVFGENALVERAPSDNQLLGQLSSVPVATATNIEEALQLGLALLPADTQQRIVLLSDGAQNAGDAMQAARLAATRDVPIDVIDLSGPASGNEALVASLQAPDTVREGQEIELVAVVESSIAQPARLRIFADQDVVVDRDVELAEGSNQFRTTVQTGEQGFQRYRAQIDPQQDDRIQNNEAAVLVQVQGPPRILLVEGTTGEADNLRAALNAANVRAETTAPTTLPTDLTSLSAYEAVVLVNVAARDLPVQTMDILPAYVRDLGKGLVMIGGNESYGVGGYGETPVEEAMPVYMDVRDREERPDLALIFVIDKSGSMDACHCSGPNRRSAQLTQDGERKIDIAKEAVTQASTLLGRRDTLGIVTFDTTARWALPATQGASSTDVAEAVAGVSPRGNTNVRAGLRAAEDILSGLDARIKHVVLLTDGWGEGGSNLDVARRMNGNGITLSVVAAGSGSASFLENLASSGGGRYYPATDMAEVPEIFLQETIVAAGNYMVERPFPPSIAGSSPIIDGLEELPILYGYNGSTLKDTARSVLVADDGSPLLAQWQYGLGRSVAWTSDTTGHWATDWVQWSEFPRFAAQLIGWVLPTTSSEGIATSIEVTGAQTTIVANASSADGSARENLALTAVLLPTGSTAEEQPAAPQEIELTQVAPGEYRASTTSPDPGTYLVRIQGQPGEAAVLSVAGLVVPYSSEYRPDQDNPELLANLMQLTSGNPLDAPADAFARDVANVTRAQEIALPLLLLALLLLPFDIATRRLLFQRRDLAATGQWFQRRARPQPAGAPAPAAPDRDSVMERLASARRRATPASKPANPEQASPEQASPEQASQPPATPARPATPATPPTDESADPLERLRAAKQRARKRARGEE